MSSVRAAMLFAGLVVLMTGGLAAPAVAAAPSPTVLALGQAARQDVASAPGSEPDTLVEPDIAASPLKPNIAVAVAHDSRFPDGGAVGITHAWTATAG